MSHHNNNSNNKNNNSHAVQTSASKRSTNGTFKPLSVAELQTVKDPKERFLLELARCASDSDESDQDDGNNINNNSGGSMTGSSGNSNGSVAMGTSTAASFMFDVDPQPSIFGNTPHEPPGEQRDEHVEVGNVGQMILAQMKADNKSSNKSSSKVSSNRSGGSTKAYAPTSVDGFLSTGAALAPPLANIKLGDIFVLVRQDTAPSSSSAATAPPPPATVASAIPAKSQTIGVREKIPILASATVALSAASRNPVSTQTPHPSIQQQQQQQQQKQSKTSSSSSSSSSGSSALSFVKEASFTKEEQLYGTILTASMWQDMFEVARVNMQARTLLALFLDGRTVSMNATHGFRYAGRLEVELYRKWKADPASRPAAVVLRSSTTASSGQNDGKISADVNCTSEIPSGNAPTTVAGGVLDWWAVPGIVVRVVDESAPKTILGKKFIVHHADRKTERIRLRLFTDTSSRTSMREPQSQNPPSEVDIVGISGVETVLPKVNEMARVVLGEHRGELVTVVGRLRGPDGEMKKVRVSRQVHHPPPHNPHIGAQHGSTDADGTNSVEFLVDPDHICALAD